MVRFFKKFDTRIAVYTGAGYAIPFEVITDETGRPYEWGVLAVQDGYLVGELEKLIQRQVGGVQEIGPAEYENLKKKGQQRLLPGWRETVWPRQALRKLHDDAVALAAVVEKPILPSVVKGLQSEYYNLTRPGGAISGWRPAAVAR
jgi:hypothetical protein